MTSEPDFTLTPGDAHSRCTNSELQAQKQLGRLLLRACERRVPMVVFITDRGTSAVGVGVSITTIPAAAYAGLAIADGNLASAGDALIVLIVNVICVVAAGVATDLLFRRHLRLRAKDPRHAGLA